MKELTNIYKEAGQRFIDDLFKDYLLVTEKLAGSSFSFERHGSEILFFKGSNKQPINLVDRTLMMYYEPVIQYILNKTDDHIKDLPEYWRFCFQYFVNNQPGAIEYDNLPSNNLVLTHIQIRNPKGKIAKVIEDPRVLRDWASAFNVTPLIPIFSGYLKEAQKKKIREFLSTPKEDHLEIFGTSSFAKYLITCLNPTIEQTTLQNNLDKPIDSIIFKFFKQGTNQVFAAKMIDPYTEALMKEKEPIDLRRAPADINEILLLDILAFIEERGLRGGELLTATPHERYLELISNLFNDYVAKRGVDLQKLDIEKAEFAKGSEFNLNLDLIKNNRTREILQKSESLQNLYKIILGSLRKKRNLNRVGAVMTASVIEDFNKLVTKISDTINKETDGKFKTFGDYLNNKVTEEIDHKDLEELIIEETVLNYNNFINLSKVDILTEARTLKKGAIEKFWINAYKQYTAKQKLITDFVKVSNRTGIPGEVLRANFGDNGGEALDAINSFLVSNVVGLKKGSYEIEELPVGYISGDYAAYKVIIKKPTKNKARQDYVPGDFFIITNRYKISKKTGAAAIVGKKDLTPAKLGIGGVSYKNWGSLMAPINNFMNNSRYPENYKNFMIEAAKEISSDTGKNYNKFDDFTAYANAPVHTITYPIKKSLFDGIDQLSIQNIRNDYGEVLGGFMLLNIIKDPGEGVSYPAGESEPLVDFYFDTYSISSKGGKKGGTPTGDTIIQRIYKMANDKKRVPGPLSFDTPSEQDFYNNVINIWVNPTKLARSQIYGRIMSLCSANLNDHSKSAYWYLLKEAELEPANATQESVEKFLDNLYTDKDEFTKFLRTFWEKSTYEWNEAKLKENVDGFGEFRGNHKLGVVFYPLMVEATKILNQKYTKELTKYAQIVTDVKQLYLEVKAKNGSFEFKTVPFSTANFVFEQKSSIPNPFNSNMGVTISK
tara:strand:- start:52 stop:2886 length:2835 start_codon:yes stop_codon:yes gene_type:complete